MIHPFAEFLLYLFLLGTAWLALRLRRLVAAVVALSAFGFTSAVLYMRMGAVDVGFTEAVVGAGVTGVLFVTAISKTSRESRD
jgi:multicomponent Na+:H+ antiporter subunit B